MTRFRLRTQLFIATLLTICGLTGALLLVLRHTVTVETERQVREGTDGSVRAFESVQRDREQQLSRTAAMLAVLPPLQAMMTTEDAPTIQDGTAIFWKLSGSHLFVLANMSKNIVALHMTRPGWPREAAERDINKSIEQGEDVSWWYDDGRLYEVFLQPITAGIGSNSRQLGWLAIGYQVDSRVAEQLEVVAGNHVALVTGSTLITSTLPSADEAALQRKLTQQDRELTGSSREIKLETDSYAVSSVLLNGALPSPVRCYVMMQLGPVNDFIRRLNRRIFVVGGFAVLFGALLFGFVSQTITKPLVNLVAGVRALAGGDFSYSIVHEGSSEVDELSSAFAKMRGELLALHKQQIETERIAALGRAARSISHDLRHYLAAVVANAEFLYEADTLRLDKNEIYQEIKIASEQMTDLIDSLRELSHEHSTISAAPTQLDQVLRRAIDAVRLRPEFHNRNITLISSGDVEGEFDARKLERAFFNLVLNACEATANGEGKVTVELRKNEDSFEIRVSDQGAGVPENIREKVFDPFVSSGKPNGTGLGLAIVSKIVSDHGGSVQVERTSPAGTVMLVKLPRASTIVTAAKNPTLA